MATETTRRRRHSPAVYRRRRIVFFVGILALIAVIWLLIAQPWRSAAQTAAQQGSNSSPGDGASTGAGVTELPVPKDGSSTPSPASTPSSTPASTPKATSKATPKATPGKTPASSPAATAGAEPCRSGDIAVAAVTDKQTYASGQNPLLSIKLTNNGDSDCTLNVGTSSQAFTITSGNDTWWRSTDCQKEPSDMIVLLSAGQTVKSAVPLTWDRTRSSVSTCSNSDRPRAPGGGASYHLAVEIGGMKSTESAQMLLY